MFGGEDRLITASDDGTVRVWRVRDQQQLLSLTGHKGAVEDAVLAQDGQILISGGRDGTVRFWRAATDTEVKAAGNW